MTEGLQRLLAPCALFCRAGAAGRTAASWRSWRAKAASDLLLSGPEDLDLAAREALAAFAETQDLARLSWRRPVACRNRWPCAARSR